MAIQRWFLGKLGPCALSLVLAVGLCPASAMAATGADFESAPAEQALSPLADDEVIASGTCGENLTWSLGSDGLLTISGTGAMADYAFVEEEDDVLVLNAPWADYTFEITCINIGAGVTSIGENAFYFCESLESVDIPEGVTSIGANAFNFCEFLESVDIPSTVTFIGEYAFYACSTMTSVAVPEGVTSIGAYTFSYCEALESASIPSTVTSIGEYAFNGCTSLDSVHYAGSNKSAITIADNNAPLLSATWYYAGGGEDVTAAGTCGDNLTWSLGTNGVLTISGTGAMTDYFCQEIDDTLVTTAPWANYASSIVSIEIASGATSVGENAFQGLTSLESVDIPTTVEYIGFEAFSGCASLIELAIPEGVTEIGYYTFSGCVSLESVSFPSTIEFIGENIFSNCPSLESFIVAEESEILLSPDGRCLVDSDGMLYAYANASGSTFEIPSSVLYIGAGAFCGCAALTELTIPEGVESVGEDAFSGCTSLTDVYYAGAAKSDIEIVDDGNDPLINATWHCEGLVLFGDVNGNGVLNIVDAQIAYDLATTTAHQSNPNYEKMMAAADVNEDGDVDALDAFAIQRALHYGWDDEGLVE